MGQRHSRAHFDLHEAMRTAAMGGSWDATPETMHTMLEDAFFTGAFCVFHALTDAKIDAVARLSVISQLSEQFDDFMRQRSDARIIRHDDHDPTL